MKVQLKNVRLSFPVLFAPKQINGQGDAKYSAAFIFERDHPAIAELTTAVTTVAKEKWGAKADEVLVGLKAAGRLPVHDGDAKPNIQGYPGKLYLNASNKVRPLVINGDKSPLTENDGKPYSGCFVNAVVSMWAQDNQHGKRVNASLMGVQFLADGERLSGGEVANADDFEALMPEKTEAAAKTGAASLF